MNRVLIIEDDTALGQGICLALQSEALGVTVCRTLSEAKKLQEEELFDLLLLDVNLPDGNGMEYLTELRTGSRVPVILLTANDLETDIVAGLELGADDYITKPFSLAVLRARVNTQLRKASERKRDFVEIDRYRFDFERMEFYKGEQEVVLSKTEQKLLRTLVVNRGITLRRNDLIDRIWTDGAEYVDENALSVAVKRLRDKLEDTPAKPKYLKTVYGIGYTWEGK
ncbi:MAG: response regulator transcription factor [Lachnospiraceae bacterium]|nr:response regulator transcription factor [Lachnospiraceae bacterium]